MKTHNVILEITFTLLYVILTILTLKLFGDNMALLVLLISCGATLSRAVVNIQALKISSIVVASEMVLVIIVTKLFKLQSIFSLKTILFLFIIAFLNIIIVEHAIIGFSGAGHINEDISKH